MDYEHADPYVFKVEFVLDGRPPVVVAMPVNDLVRRLEISWGYLLKNGKHTLELRVLNPREGEHIRVDELITYSARPAKAPF